MGTTLGERHTPAFESRAPTQGKGFNNRIATTETRGTVAYWLDDGFDTWPETVRAGKAAAGLYVCCGAWIARSIGNGSITEPVVPAEIATMYGTPEWVAKLLLVGLWTAEGAGYRDVRYHGMGNPTADKVARDKAQAAKRQALFKNPALRKAITLRDKDACRYCGVKVKWTDRKGEQSGTYDKVDPAGPNDFDNIVVCCRACLAAKGERTPAEAGLLLRRIPGSKSDLNPIQNGSETEQVSNAAPSLPPSKEGKGERPPASLGGARALPPDPPPPELVADVENPDWRTNTSFEGEPDPALVEERRRRMALVRAEIRQPANGRTRPGPVDIARQAGASQAGLTAAVAGLDQHNLTHDADAGAAS